MTTDTERNNLMNVFVRELLIFSHSISISAQIHVVTADSYEECVAAFKCLLKQLPNLGFTINWKKVVPPTQSIIFLGVLIDTVSGARVLLACRDITKAERAAEDIRQSTGNKDVFVYVLDLASLESVRQCANEVLRKESRLDVLINNAGIVLTQYWKTEDGFEMQFGTNHLGHFLFTNLLLDLLKKSAPSRIVNVAALAHKHAKINFDDLNSQKEFSFWKAYSQSKLANVLFTRELSKRLQGTSVTTNSLHPGLITTEIGRHVGIFRWCRFLFYPVLFIMFKTAEQGAQTTIYCAVATELDGVSGTYFSDCAVKKEAPQARDDADAARLWKVSEEMVGLAQKS